MVAITDPILLHRLTELEKQGIRVAELPDAFGEGRPALALIQGQDLSTPIVMIPYTGIGAETEYVRRLLLAYDLDQMVVDNTRLQ